MKVYLIYRNTDMVEGRGTMQMAKLIGDKARAIKFALEQPGVMGITNQRQVNKSTKIGLGHGTLLVEGSWEVVEVEVE